MQASEAWVVYHLLPVVIYCYSPFKTFRIYICVCVCIHIHFMVLPFTCHHSTSHHLKNVYDIEIFFTSCHLHTCHPPSLFHVRHYSKTIQIFQTTLYKHWLILFFFYHRPWSEQEYHASLRLCGLCQVSFIPLKWGNMGAGFTEKSPKGSTTLS